MLPVLIQILIALLIVGLILWAVSQFPIDATIARIIRVVVIVVVCIWLIYLLAGFLPGGGFATRFATIPYRR